MPEILVNNKGARVLSFISFSVLFLLTTTLLIPTAVGQELYSGRVSFVQYNDDGSFSFQLSEQGIPVIIKNPKCGSNNMLLVKKLHRKVNYEKLNRMRNDIRSVFLNSAKLKISVFISFCDEATGHPLVDNIMLGQRKS
ncbi:hypothetical protein [Litorilituus lipolyticus]|uniref:Uncharacterized protein n=1 Tax=Litorilituus lipolyticus TaxID=2491017 RepID=A0A502KVF9_9GAMM|nr:hypothetical protein [Litorilituus lipolyticus]TPH13961.1 hypothetical protein EPA86_12660 [Litorilituus lipolyticus]